MRMTTNRNFVAAKNRVCALNDASSADWYNSGKPASDNFRIFHLPFSSYGWTGQTLPSVSFVSDSY